MSRGPYGRKDKLIVEKRHDVYQERNKWPSPTLCTECDALFVNGRWVWGEAPSSGEVDQEPASRVICPACRRIADRYPAGYVEIKGPFFKEHRQEILNLINNIAGQEKSEHPMERTMDIKAKRGQVLVTTTGIHLARRIGEALSRAYKGDLSVQYADGEHSIQVRWQR